MHAPQRCSSIWDVPTWISRSHRASGDRCRCSPCLTISCLTGRTRSCASPGHGPYERQHADSHPALNQWLRALRSRTAFPQRSASLQSLLRPVRRLPSTFQSHGQQPRPYHALIRVLFENRSARSSVFAGIPVIVDFRGRRSDTHGESVADRGRRVAPPWPVSPSVFLGKLVRHIDVVSTAAATPAPRMPSACWAKLNCCACERHTEGLPHPGVPLAGFRPSGQRGRALQP